MPIQFTIPAVPAYSGWNVYFNVFGEAASVATATEVYVDGDFLSNNAANRNEGGIDMVYDAGFWVGQFPAEEIPTGTYPIMIYRRIGAENDTLTDPTMMYDIPANQLTFVAATRLVQACQAVTNEINDVIAEGMTAERVYFLAIPSPEQLTKDAVLMEEFSGVRKVFVEPLEDVSEVASNTSDSIDLSMRVSVYERYDGDNAPPNSWLDERVAWLTLLFDRLSNPRRVTDIVYNASPVKELCSIATFNVDMLANESAYFGSIILTYRQLNDGTPEAEDVETQEGARSYYAYWFGGGSIVQ